jgi:P pilus assembly chaperone PapD
MISHSKTILITVALLLLAQVAQGAMRLSNVIVHFEPGKPARQDVEISNTGDEPMYVSIEPNMILAPGTPQEDRVPITDPRQAGLLVTPNKMIVPPGGTKVLRLVDLGGFPRERVYRIVVKPVAAGVESSQSGLKIMLGYEILAIAYPSNPSSMLDVTREGRVLRMKNPGNTNILLREGYQCERANQPVEECDSLPGKRLYPGNEWEISLPRDLPVTYYHSVGTQNFVEEYR